MTLSKAEAFAWSHQSCTKVDFHLVFLPFPWYSCTKVILYNCIKFLNANMILVLCLNNAHQLLLLTDLFFCSINVFRVLQHVIIPTAANFVAIIFTCSLGYWDVWFWSLCQVHHSCQRKTELTICRCEKWMLVYDNKALRITTSFQERNRKIY